MWIKYDDCVGCNLCHLVCPVEGCITMVEQDTDYEPLTWAQYEDGADPNTLAPRPKHDLTIGT